MTTPIVPGDPRPGPARRSVRIVGIVAAFAPLAVAAALGACWARSVRVQETFNWERSGSRLNPGAGTAAVVSDTIRVESGLGVIGVVWSHHDWNGSGLPRQIVDAVGNDWPARTSFERKTLGPDDRLFGRVRQEVGPWRVLHHEYRLRLSEGYMIGGPQRDFRREFAAPYWLLMIPLFLPAIWWLWCPSGRAVPRLTVRRLAILIGGAALACATLVAFGRASARDRRWR